jgi:hypothetical protein
MNISGHTEANRKSLQFVAKFAFSGDNKVRVGILFDHRSCCAEKHRNVLYWVPQVRDERDDPSLVICRQTVEIQSAVSVCMLCQIDAVVDNVDLFAVDAAGDEVLANGV